MLQWLISNGNNQSITSLFPRWAAPVAHGEPRQGEVLLGGDLPEQVCAGVAGCDVCRGGGGGSLLRVDRQYAKAVARWPFGATPVATSAQKPLDATEH